MSPTHGICLRTLLASAVAVVLLVPPPADAFHRESPFLQALTSFPGGVSTNPAAAIGEPARVAFESLADLKHNGSVGRQIFYFVLSPNAGDPKTLHQITNFAGAESANPTANANAASRIAFESTEDLFGTQNPARQIFVYYRDIEKLVVLTNGLTDSTRPSLDEHAFNVAFQSTADLKGSGAATAFSQIFVYNIAGTPPPCDLSGCHPDPNRLYQVTAFGANSTNPAISANGRYIFFQSDVGGVQQIFVADLGAGGAITQITNGAADSTNPSPDSIGQLVAFQSQADLLGLGSSGSEIFLYDTERQTFRQVTNGAGENTKPSLGVGDQGISFLSTGDLLGTGAVGQHLFLYDPRTDRLFQVTKGAGTVDDNPMTAGNFIVWDTDEDMLNVGMTGRQVYALDTYGRIPKVAIGKKIVPFAGGGQLLLDIGDRDGRAEANITVPAGFAKFPPIDVPGYGVACLTPTGNGTGVIACVGSRDGGDLVVTRDHVIDDLVDPTCTFQGDCREGTACHLPFPSPHQNPCPACVGGACVGGPNAGQPCSADTTCLQNVQCINGQYGICNGPTRVAYDGTYARGGVQLTIPVTLSLSLNPGIDGVYCTSNDSYVFQNVPISLALTTGALSATIDDANDTPLAQVTLQDTGSPFDCVRLEQGNFQDVVLVGAIPLLDAPTTPPGIADTIIDVRLQALAGKPFAGCTTLGCSILTYCTTNADCGDSNVCNGQETCVNNTCVPGAPLVCDDGQFCNGLETCDELLGCMAGPAPNCNDGALCTTDTCDGLTQQCQNVPIPGCCTSDADCRDNNVCNGAERCAAGTCVPGAPLQCSDGNACNGVETCDPVAGCLAGTPPTCADGARCTTDRCDTTLGCVSTSVPGCCTSDADCRDINVCNGEETCVAGNCVPGTPLACDDGDVCNGIETCDPSGGCQPGTPVVCVDDGAPCTADICDPVQGCIHPSISGCCMADVDCQDTNACNGIETCVAGDCIPGTPLVCSNNDVCDGIETCNATLGCLPGAPITCADDGAACTADLCDPVQGCIHPSISGCCSSDADCQDVSSCNGLERCVAGDCVPGTPVFCDDGDACNGAEVCDDTLGCVAGAVPAPYTEVAVRCALDLLWSTFRADSPSEFGGRKHYTGLQRILIRVRKNFLYYSPRDNGKPQRSIMNPGNAVKLLRLFNRRLNGGMNRFVINPSIAVPLVDLSNDAIDKLLQYNLGAPKPGA